MLVPARKLVRIEDTIKRSRFIASLTAADSEEEAREFIHDIRREFSRARHHCSAFIVGTDAHPIARSSDDGEPAGTAGMPMLETLEGSGLVNVCVVVTRYFGGIKLGTGGLVRAYSTAVSHALAHTSTLQRTEVPLWSLKCPINEAAALLPTLQQLDYDVCNTQWGDPTRLTIATTNDHIGELKTIIAHKTRGKGKIQREGTIIREIPGPTLSSTHNDS